MTSASSDDGAAIAQAHDFSGSPTIVDVGGGHGALLAAILDRYPNLSGVVFDLPNVIDTASGDIDRHTTSGRIATMAGDFFEQVPSGGDAYLLKWIVHDWPDEAAVKIRELPIRDGTGRPGPACGNRHARRDPHPRRHAVRRHHARIHPQPGTHRGRVP